VKDEGVRKREPGTDQTERQGGIEDDRGGAMLEGEPLDPPGNEWRREKYWLSDPDNRKRLRPVERFRTRVRRCEHHDVVWGQTPPELPQVGLDAPNLWGEVVGNEKVAQGSW
jgi:hypothetical protein